MPATGMLEKIDEYRWRIPKSHKSGMRVDGVIYADERMIKDIGSDKAPERAPLKLQTDTKPINRDASERVSYAPIVKKTAASVVFVYSIKKVPGRAGWELRLVVQGGLRILDKIDALSYATLRTRPKLTAWDAPLMLWRAIWM